MKTRYLECRLIPRIVSSNVITALAITFLGIAPVAATAAEDVVAERYSLYCSVCHGDHGDGDSRAQQGLIPPPRDFTDAAFAGSVTRERLLAAITNGLPGTAMIAWKTELDPAEIAELADYILTNFVGAAPSTSTGRREPLPKAESLRIYQESCSVCHGDDGTGAVWGQNSLSTAPRDFTTEQARIELTRDRMIKSVTHGRPGTPMPGFSSQLDDRQVTNIVDYIRTRFMATAPHTDAQTVANDYHERQFPNALAGNFERGRSLYFQNCLVCHGSGGAGDGPRAYFIFPKPRNFLDPATREILNRPRLFDGVKKGVVGREMPAWGFVMEDQDIADVAEYVFREFITAETTSP